MDLTAAIEMLRPTHPTISNDWTSMSSTPITSGAVEPLPEDLLVADLVAEDPRRAAVFERVGIDYCCGGAVPLSQACTEHGLDVAVVQDLLDEATRDDQDTQSWADASIPELVENIVDGHHAYLATALPRITLLAHKVARAHGDTEPDMRVAEAVVVQMVSELRAHTAEEEADVFPRCIDAVEGRVDGDEAEELATLLGGLVEDHDETGQHLERLRELTNGFTPPGHACTTWRAYLDALDRLEQDIHRHVHKENHILFPKVMELLYAVRATG